MATKRKPSIYDGVESDIIRRIDERIPFNCFKEKINWDEVLKWMNENLPKWTIDIEWKKDGE
ncbi:MAG: hypothetical protein EHM34_00155 [Nitrosopumilales archaeon]|nr:MAG: hypothetical protein EHM34_00155 [Nitrosopumilales archaeon]